jgi:hypothetical protein
MEPKTPSRSAASARRGLRRIPRDLDLHVAIADVEPPIWRLVRVPDEYTLHQLHRVFQLVFGWQDYHLYDFRVGERRFEAPDPEAEDEDSTAVRLRDLELGKGSRLTYTYDFGDDWLHEIVVKEIHTAVRNADEPPLPALLDGARAGPHEDSGGPSGYERMVKALGSRRHPEHGHYREWAGDRYDPERFDPWLADQNLTLAAAWGAI